MTALFLIIAIVILAEDFYWAFQLVGHFQRQLLLGSTLSLLILLVCYRHRRGSIAVFLLCSFIFLWNTSPYSLQGLLAAPHKIGASSPLSIFYANVNTQNSKKDGLVNLLKKNKPALVLLVELNRPWGDTLKILSKDYPYSRFLFKENNFGMGILSRYPFDVSNVYWDRENLIPALFVDVVSPQGPLKVALLHAFPPISKTATEMRDRYLETIALRIGELTGATLVCGDFNTTPWSNIFEVFIKHSKLEFSGLAPGTWPAVLGRLGLPIDHCLFKDIEIVEYRRGESIGSDHYPLRLFIEKAP